MKHYIVVNMEQGIYVLFLYNSRPFRYIVIGKVDTKQAYRIALEENKFIHRDSIEVRDGSYNSNIMSDVMGRVHSFLPLSDNGLRSINTRSKIQVEYDIDTRLSIPVHWSSEQLEDGTIIEYEYDPKIPDRVHGRLWIKTGDDQMNAHLYVLVEGVGIAYMYYNNKELHTIVDLVNPNINVLKNLRWSYDDQVNQLTIGNTIVQYQPDKAMVKIPGFILYYRRGTGYKISFVDYKGYKRTVMVYPVENWWKYVNLTSHDVIRYLR